MSTIETVEEEMVGRVCRSVFTAMASILLVAGPSNADLEPWQGYRPTANTEIAFKDKIMASVFMTLTAGGSSFGEDAYKIEDVDQSEEVTDKAILDGPDYRPFQRETCRRQNIRKCPVMNAVSRATGSIEDGNRLSTCRHSMHNWFYLVTKHNPIKIDDIIPAIQIINHEGEVIYNSAYSPQAVTPSYYNKDPRMDRYILGGQKTYAENTEEISSFFSFADYMEMKFDQSIVPPVSFRRARSFEKIKTIYISGYPGVTDLFGGVENGDSDGTQLSSSIGAPTELFLGYRSIETSAIFSTGMSGGLALNEFGEKVGIACYKSVPPNESSILITDHQMLDELWDYLLTNSTR